jgi:hypothetical protein
VEEAEYNVQPETPKPSDDPALDPVALAAIRAMLADQPPAPPGPETPTAEPLLSTHKASRFPDLTEADSRPSLAASMKRRKPSLQSRFKLQVPSYRPTRRHIVLALLALTVLLWPWLVLAAVLLLVMLLTGAFLILGYDGFWRRAIGVAKWYARRRPAHADRLHRKVDRFAMKWDAVLDQFPEGTVDGLYLPDFGVWAEAEARHDAALARRLDGLREHEG